MIAYVIGLGLPVAAVTVPSLVGRFMRRADGRPTADYPRALAFEQEAHRTTRATRDARIRELEAENAALRGQLRRMEGVQ